MKSPAPALLAALSFAGLVWGIFLARAQTGPAAEMAADLVLVNGNVVTVNDDFSVEEALAVRGERLIAVGTDAEIRAHIGPSTIVMDLEGKTVLPGLIDSHVHATGAAVFEFDHPVPAMESIPEVLRYVEERADVLEDGEWIRLQQVFITRLRERRFPTREELDRAAPKNPVWFRTGPDAALNSLALERIGIDRNYQLPDGATAKIERDPTTGEPTGIIRSAGGLANFESSEKSPQFEDQVNRLGQLMADYNRAGLTSVSDRNTSDDALRIYEELRRRGGLTCRTYLYYQVDGGATPAEIESRLSKAADHPLHQYDNMLWLRGAKVFLDGGMLTGSAYMIEPWGVSKSYGIDDPEYRGMRYVEEEKLYQIAKHALESGFQFTAHAVGDGAVQTLVDAYTRIAENDFPIRDKRPCVTHCNFMTLDAIEKMSAHGIVADLQPAWLFLDGSTLLNHFGEDRLTLFQPYKTLFEKGVVVGGGSDHMQKIGSLRSVNPYNPFLGMWIALTRQPRWLEQRLQPEERITREQVLRLYTMNNAYLTFEEKEKGSLEAGKLADFIVIDRDILTCPLDEVGEILVERTWLGGKLVYAREE